MGASSLVFSSLALEDAEHIFNWYEEQQKGLGHKFLDSLQKTGDLIKKTPFGFQSRFKTSRETLIQPFPYLIIYTIEDNTIYVNSIFPTKMNPRKKYSPVVKPSKRKK